MIEREKEDQEQLEYLRDERMEGKTLRESKRRKLN